MNDYVVRTSKNKTTTANYHVSTPKGSRTPTACLEGKHDNRFTIGVTNYCGSNKTDYQLITDEVVTLAVLNCAFS